jgi:hypothetical protein
MPRIFLTVILSIASCSIFAGPLLASTSGPSIALSSPSAVASETDEPTIDLRGTATSQNGFSNVLWVDQAGKRGTASWTPAGDGKANWEALGVVLRPGINQITVTAVDSANHSASLHVVVRRKVAAGSQQALEVRTGVWKNQPITYQVWNGMAVVEGDIILGPVSAVAQAGMPALSKAVQGEQPDGLAISYVSQLWPFVEGEYQVPYTITGTSTSNLTTAISNFNTQFSGLIQFVAWSGQTNYVNITVESGGSTEGFSDVGMVGNEQSLNCGSGCTVATWMHEMGHTVGLEHEHQRPDRASYITLNLANADLPNVPGNFTLPTSNAQMIGLFDFASVMEYGAFDFTKIGLPVIESIPPGIPLSNDVGYPLGDVDQVERLYGATPSAVTITTNPPQLQIIVDGTTYTAPQTFSWTLSSAHTINVPADPQVTNPSDGSTYAFGVWNDLGARTHSITVTPGSGSLTAPATEPAVTVYEANFIRLQPFGYLSPSVYPSGAGTLAVSPTPTSEYGGTFFTDRTLVTLTLAPTQGSGYNFYDWYNLPFPPSDNPHQFYIQAPTTQAQAVFVSDPVTIVGQTLTGPNTWNPGLYGYVDTFFTYLPTGFDATYNGSGWAAGTSHTINVDQTQSPITTNVFYNWNSWSDAGAMNHGITQPASGSQTITASFTPFYASYTVPPALGLSNSACYGGVSMTPVGTSYAENTVFDFYQDGTSVTTTATANPVYPGMLFAGWTGSLSGTTNPEMTTIHDQFVPTANFNTVPTPLAVTGFTPATAQATSSAMDITVNGTGFATNTFVNWNGSSRSVTYVSSTQLTLHLVAGDLATAGGQALYFGNNTTNSSNSTCGIPYNATFIVTGPGPAAVQLSAATLSFGSQPVGTTSAAQSVTVTNTGGTALSISSIVDGGFNPTSFPETTTCGTGLAAGANCTINAKFAPGGTGGRSAVITLTDSAGTQTIALSGAGIAAIVSPTSLAFGSQPVGTKSAVQTVTVTNTGASTMSISIVEGGFNPTSFPETTTCGASLAAAANCTVSVQFSPGGSGARSATITLTDSYGTQSITLSGTGVASILSATSLAFGSQPVGTKSAVQTVTVTNTGTGTMTINSIVEGGFNPTSFPETTTCGTSLAVGAKCTISAQFSPGGTGARSATITLSDSYGTQTVALSGTGVASILNPSSLSFGNQTVGTKSAVQTITVTNTGTSTMTISSIVEGGFNPTSFPETSTCGSSLTAGANCTISVQFSPGGTGARSATVTLTDSYGTQSIALSGTGVAAIVNPLSLSFGNQTVGTKSAAQIVTVTNTGTSTLTISSIVEGGFNPTSFPETTTCGSSLTAGANCTISVQFSPGGAGSRSATITLTNSDGTQTVSLTGTGVAP